MRFTKKRPFGLAAYHGAHSLHFPSCLNFAVEPHTAQVIARLDREKKLSTQPRGDKNTNRRLSLEGGEVAGAELALDPDRLLDLSAPLSWQTPEVQNSLQATGMLPAFLAAESSQGQRGMSFYSFLRDHFGREASREANKSVSDFIARCDPHNVVGRQLTTLEVLLDDGQKAELARLQDQVQTIFQRGTLRANEFLAAHGIPGVWHTLGIPLSGAELGSSRRQVAVFDAAVVKITNLDGREVAEAQGQSVLARLVTTAAATTFHPEATEQARDSARDAIQDYLPSGQEASSSQAMFESV